MAEHGRIQNDEIKKKKKKKKKRQNNSGECFSGRCSAAMFAWTLPYFDMSNR